MNTLRTYLAPFLANRIPPQLVVQYTNHCNARCPQCGMRKTERISRFKLSREKLKRIVDAAAAKGVKSLSFTGGEPLLHLEEVIELMTYADSLGIPNIRTGTNGFLFRGVRRPDFEDRMKRLAERLACTSVRNFWISIDAAIPEVHEKMRGFPGVVAGIEKALPIFHAAELYPSANLGINRWMDGDNTRLLDPSRHRSRDDYLEAFRRVFRTAFDRFYRFVGALGFTIVNACYPMSVGDDEREQGLRAVYAATSAEDVIRFDNAEKKALFEAMLDAIPEHRHRLRIFTPLSSLHMLVRQYGNSGKAPEAAGCRGGVDFFFIDAADGETYPCGYRGEENMGPFPLLDLSVLGPVADCQRCDWECFRDPSEMFSPFLQSMHAPLDLARRLYKDPVYLKLWTRDVLYYKACDLFDGRKPFDSSRLRRFRKQ